MVVATAAAMAVSNVMDVDDDDEDLPPPPDTFLVEPLEGIIGSGPMSPVTVTVHTNDVHVSFSVDSTLSLDPIHPAPSLAS